MLGLKAVALMLLGKGAITQYGLPGLGRTKAQYYLRRLKEMHCIGIVERGGGRGHKTIYQIVDYQRLKDIAYGCLETLVDVGVQARKKVRFSWLKPDADAEKYRSFRRIIKSIATLGYLFTLKELAKRGGMSYASVRRCLARLDDDNIIARRTRGQGMESSAIYEIMQRETLNELAEQLG